jgi:hypothetical protein
MLKKRGNFPYDYDSKIPDPPRIPSRIVLNPPPAPTPTESPSPDIPEALTDPEVLAKAIARYINKEEAEIPPSPLDNATTSIPPDQPEISLNPAETQPRKPRRRSERSQPAPAPEPPPDPNEPASSRHARRCVICHHPDREAIDDDILHWIKSTSIAYEYGMSRMSVLRHARATGLIEQRARKYRVALDLIIENAGSAVVSGDTVLRAIRATSCINDAGEWVEPPKHVLYSFEHLPVRPIAPASAVPSVNPSDGHPVLEVASPVSADGGLTVHETIRN